MNAPTLTICYFFMTIPFFSSKNPLSTGYDIQKSSYSAPDNSNLNSVNTGGFGSGSVNTGGFGSGSVNTGRFGSDNDGTGSGYIDNGINGSGGFVQPSLDDSLNNKVNGKGSQDRDAGSGVKPKQEAILSGNPNLSIFQQFPILVSYTVVFLSVFWWM